MESMDNEASGVISSPITGSNLPQPSLVPHSDPSPLCNLKLITPTKKKWKRRAQLLDLRRPLKQSARKWPGGDNIIDLQNLACKKFRKVVKFNDVSIPDSYLELAEVAQQPYRTP